MRPLIAACRAFTHREEGLVLHAYDDKDGARIRWDGNAWRREKDGGIVLGFPTIGRGRRLWPGEVVETCTVEQADAWFDQRVAEVDLPAVDKYWPEADDWQRGALADYSYNCGSSAIYKDRFHDIFAEGGYDALGAVWLRSRITSGGHPAPVLVGRRAREWAMFCTLRDHPELRSPDVTDEQVQRALVAREELAQRMVADLLSLSTITLSSDEDPH